LKTVMDKQDLITYWLESSDRDFQTMIHLFEKGDYTRSLFIGHLVLEKLMKAWYVQHVDNTPPFIHDLVRLAERGNMLLDERKKEMDQRKAPETAIRYINFLRTGNPKIVKAYLFGSYAKGNADINSDIDIAIIFENFPDIFDMQVQLMKLRRKFDTRIEPHPFREKDFNTSNPTANEILATGVELT